MDETPGMVPDDPEIPATPPPADDGIEVEDHPLGVPEGSDPGEAPLPGVPEKEPPVSG